MPDSALRDLGPVERALVARLIAKRLFEDEDEFEAFAVRRALAQVQWEELWELQSARPPPKVTMERIVEEVRKVRRAAARKHSMSQG